MGGVDLADILIALYRILLKSKRWYIKVFWNLVDIAKVNGWIFLMRISWKSYKSKQDCCQHFQSLTKKKEKWCCMERGGGWKGGGGGAAIAIPCHDVRYDGVGHWPVANSNKSPCRKCQKYCGMVCEKRNYYSCLLDDTNCFKLFHT